MAEPAITQTDDRPALKDAAPFSCGAVSLVASVVGWLIWGVMFAAAILYVRKYGTNVPSWDDWDMVPTLTHHQPVTLGWLWSQHNEHRVPLPRLIDLALARAFGTDFRVWMYFNVITTALLAAAMMLVARRLRGGRTSAADAFFPLLLLNWGQGLNFVWGWQVEFFTSTLLAGAVLLTILGARGGRISNARALTIAALLVGLVLCGAHGVAMLPAMVAWLAFIGVLRWRDRRAGAGLLISLALLAAVIAAAYFIGYHAVPGHPRRPRWFISILTAMQFLTMGFGPAIKRVWPVSGAIVFVILASTVLLLAFVAWRRRDQRERALGILAFLGAMGCLAGAIGLGRDGFEDRYITLSVPALAAAFYAWLRYGGSRARVALPAILCLLSLLALSPNTESGVEYGAKLKSFLGGFERDMVAGTPEYLLLNRYGPWLHPHTGIVTDYLPMLREAHVGHFASLKDNPPMREIPLNADDLVLLESRNLKWDSATRTASCGAWPEIAFRLPRPMFVAGIRLRYTHRSALGVSHWVELEWKNEDRVAFDDKINFLKYSPTGDRANWPYGDWTRIGRSDSTMTAWPCMTIDAIRIMPDFTPCTFRIDQITLLVPR